MDHISMVLTFKWAGLGGMAMGFLFLKDELAKLTDPKDMKMQIHSMTDYNPQCQGNGTNNNSNNIHHHSRKHHSTRINITVCCRLTMPSTSSGI